MSRSQPEPSANTGGRRQPNGFGNVRGEATRQLILRAAEQLFAEGGISGVPLRDIGVAAGQRNHAAVQYHFGDRGQLVQAIVEARGRESEEGRLSVVTELMIGGTVPTVTDVVDAFVRPLAVHIRPDNHYLAFLSHLITEKGGYEGLEGVHTGASVITLRQLLGRLRPEIPAAVLDERWVLSETSAVHALARYQAAQRQQRAYVPAEMDVWITDLVAFLSAGIVAPLGPGDPRASGAPGQAGSEVEVAHEA